MSLLSERRNAAELTEMGTAMGCPSRRLMGDVKLLSTTRALESSDSRAFAKNIEALSGIANTANLLYTYSAGNLCSVQRPSDSGVSQAYHFIECRHQPPG